MKRRTFIITAICLCALLALVFRFELLFYFQYHRLKGISNIENDKSCFNKFWAHRVNTSERFDIVSEKFTGVETDIVFDSTANCFWVYHPPLIEKGKLPLDSFIKSHHNASINYWFDTRSVDSSNCMYALKVFNQLDQLYHFKSKAIIELYDWHAANYMAAEGYQISLNIPPPAFSDNNLMQEISTHLSEKVKFVSQESEYVQQLEKDFPKKQIITWSISFWNYFNRAGLKKLATDSRVECILVNVKSRRYK